tara:strand:+ start:642 stop:821 length:180 start_codon:yes stop_codon:yes gene_type:complete
VAAGAVALEKTKVQVDLAAQAEEDRGEMVTQELRAEQTKEQVEEHHQMVETQEMVDQVL